MMGFMHYCCWPCVCDTQDFIRVDTLNVTLKGGVIEQRYFAVIGNPCDHPEALELPFVQPFGRKYETTLSETAREVRCQEDGTLEGATVSDHGYIIIGMFFEAFPAPQGVLEPLPEIQAGRVTTEDHPVLSGEARAVVFQDEREWVEQCTDRANNGYNSGMGEIFRKVSAISPITEKALLGPGSSFVPGTSMESGRNENIEPSCDARPDSIASRN